jgi:hypothetical protein
VHGDGVSGKKGPSPDCGRSERGAAILPTAERAGDKLAEVK